MATPDLIITRDDGVAWSPDAASRVVVSRPARVTEHPIETGVTVSDHRAQQPTRITVRAMVTETPWQGRTWDQPTGPDRLTYAADFLAGCTSLVTLSFQDGDFESYALTGDSSERTPVRGRPFTLEFVQVVQVDPQTVEISVSSVPASQATGMPTEVDAGEQGTTTDDGSSESILYSLLYGSSAPEDT